MSLDTTEEAVGWLRLRVGTFKRVTSASAAKSRRWIEIDNCTVADGSIKDASENLVFLTIYEDNTSPPWPDDPEKIGGLRVDHGIRATVVLPTVAFEQFWAAAAAADGVSRQIQIGFRERGREHGKMTWAIVDEASLTEFMSGDVNIEFDQKTGRQKAVPPRRDLVSQEIRSFWNSAKGVNNAIARGVSTAIVLSVVVLAISWIIRHLS
jgi:hypothetical protein